MKQKTSKAIIIIGICIFIIISIISIFLIYSNRLNKDEEYVYNIIKQYQKQLKDPKSMQLYGDSLWVYGLDNEIGSEELKPHNYVYFSTSATNSFGGRIRNTAMINDLKFVGYAEEEPNMPNLNDDSKEEIIEYLQFLHNKAPLLAYRAMGEDMTENENFISVKVINCKKIAKKLGCEYIDE